MPATMKAMRVEESGSGRRLAYADVPVPAIAPDQVLVKIRAAGVNALDAKIRHGATPGNLAIGFPFILGGDIAGTVERVGALVSRFTPGDAVFGRIPSLSGGGFAEFVALRSDYLAPAPTSVGATETAGLPAAAATAWSALFDVARLKAGQRILIHAAAGGVGTFAVQMAKLVGAHVTGTCSAANTALVKSLGADETIDYRSEDFSLRPRDFDAVLDAVGGETEAKSLRVLKPGGMLVGIVAPPDAARAKAQGVSSRFVALDLIGNNGARMQEIAGLVDSGRLKIVVNRVFPLAEAEAALELSRTGHAWGRVILEVA